MYLYVGRKKTKKIYFGVKEVHENKMLRMHSWIYKKLSYEIDTSRWVHILFKGEMDNKNN